MNPTVRSFRDLLAWQSAMDLVVCTYEIASQLPLTERFELSAQMRRAAVSVPSNIAEGHAFRTKPMAYKRYVRIALGSLAELDTDIEIVVRLAWMSPDRVVVARGLVRRTGQLLHGLLRALGQK